MRLKFKKKKKKFKTLFRKGKKSSRNKKNIKCCLIKEMALSSPLNFLSVAIASGFYGSIVSYTLLPSGNNNNNRNVFAKLKIGFGFLGGSLTGISVLTFIMANHSLNKIVLNDYSGMFYGLCFASHFWCALVWISFLFRDRLRGNVYGTIDQSYLEAAADGIFIVNLPLTGFFLGAILQTISSVRNYFSS